MAQLVMVGACYVDTILSVDHYPGEDEKLRASSLNRRRGGNCPNSLEVLQQLVHHSQTDLSLSLISVFPKCESDSTTFIRQSLGSSINCDGCIYRQDHTEPASSYVIHSQKTNSRTIVNYNDLSEMTFEEFESCIGRVQLPANCWFHFEGRIPDTTLECILFLREHHPSVMISVELEKPGRPGLEKLAAEADLVFYAKGWAQASGYRSMEECLQSQSQATPKSKYLCCTWGENGAALLTKFNNSCISVPALKISEFEIVDTIGAGDTFIAGIFFGLLCHNDDWNWTRKLRFANELAGRKVIQNGFQGLGSVMTHHME
ncbi:putative ketohexokinase [Talaromyces proteolyticus]|uniref:Ketohexokinase n=1 Tax=Talaromyces proteolyticus TaxID=1131652 RepID=A0AAD4KY31_9EURO|nr:putative ketohexokinase [Talaromyces proteolyticus]KAH8702385.1 putative ketohexokinase [Talaromyces proteolyticus]